ncbi:MAG: hypothetical protein JO061_07195, partial [Acidobacteriaceae bacterium]|nr:hypothetical protein [Acidobacteriaceae bacterium]
MNVLFRTGSGLAVAASAILASTFSGVVSDAGSGKPISDAFVTVASKVVRTDAKGQFHIDGTGSVVSARAYGYGRAQIAVTQPNTQPLQLKLSPITPRAVYLSFWGAGSAAVREPVLKLADEGVINAVVIDVKGDLGYLSFQTGVPLAGAVGAQKTTTIPDIRALLDRLHNRGIYTIGRIVTFKDNTLCTA